MFGAHTIGVLAGLLAHQVFAPDLTLAAMSHPLGLAGIDLALSAIMALSLTTGLMRGTGWTHSPACATTLIIALGLISGPQETLLILAAVTIIYGTHLLNERLFRKTGWIE